MQVRAKHRYVHISAQKARLVADLVRGQSAEKAMDTLAFSNKKAAAIIKKVLHSAISNAENNEGADIDELYISEILVDEGPSQRRFKPRARGRSSGIIKRSCHISITVSDRERT